MEADKHITSEIVDTVASLLTAYEARDLEKVMALYAPDADVTALGTNLDQFLMGLEEVRQAYEDDFEAFGRSGLRMTEHHVSAEGGAAWLAAKCDAHFEVDGEEIRSQSRLTAVFVKRDGRWRIIQFHLSFPADLSGAESPQNRL